MKQIFFAGWLMMGSLFMACSSNDEKCDNTTGNFICINGTYYEITSKQALPFGGTYPSVEITLNHEDANYNSYSIQFSLFNTAYDTTPEAGTYTLTANVPTSGGSRKVRPYGTFVQNGNITYWQRSTSGSSSEDMFTLNVQPNGTEYIVSGRYTGKLKNIDNPNEEKSIVANFENLTYVP